MQRHKQDFNYIMPEFYISLSTKISFSIKLSEALNSQHRYFAVAAGKRNCHSQTDRCSFLSLTVASVECFRGQYKSFPSSNLLYV